MSWSQALPDEIDRGFDHFAGLRSASEAVLCQLIQAADISQHWMGDGARSLDDWVSVKLRLRAETARQLVRIARRLLDLPLVTERFAAGDLSLDQVDSISRVAQPDTEESLIEEALGLSNHALDRLARLANPPQLRDEHRTYHRRSLFMQWNLDESELKLNGNLPATQGEIVQEALESRAVRYGPNPSTGMFDAFSTRLADALVEMAATTSGSPPRPPQVSVHVDLDALVTEGEGVAELFHGALVPNETARRLCCDAAVEAVVHKDGVVVGVGRNRRTIPGWLRRVVYHRDGNRCRFPGCRHTRWLEVHHRQHWAHGGRTDLDNLILICGYHHRFVHEHGWHITGPPDMPTFRKPDWRPYPNRWEALDPRLRELVRQT